MRQTIFILTLTLLINKIDAQSFSFDSLKYKYNNLHISRYGSAFLKGNQRLGFKELSKEFSMSDLGLDLYAKAKKQKTTSTIFRYASMACSIAFFGVAASDGNRNLAYGFFGGQMVFLMGSMRYQALSTQSLDRALIQRNKDLLFPQQ
jgi:hypothetical protein